LFKGVVKIFHLTLNVLVLLHYLVDLTVTIAADFSGILHARLRNSSCNIMWLPNSTDLNPES